MSEQDRRGPDVSPDQVQAYLQSTQWFEDGTLRSVATVWHRQDNEAAEVVLPYQSARDFRQRLRDALEAIALFENRVVAELLRDIKRIFSNTITVRVIHADTNDGTIPISDGVLLISKAKDLLFAAAQSVYSKKKHFLGGAPKEAKAYLDTLLLGQTEIGSYVVNIIAPSQANLAADDATAETVPLAQAVTLSLVTGLEALAEASEDFELHGSLQAFDNAVQAGASANMCDALLGLSGENRNRTFEVTVTASAGPLFESKPKKFEFDLDHVSLLEKVTDYYKDDYVLPQRVITGHIVKLSRKQGEDSGSITVDSTVGDVERKVKVELSGDDYHLAVLAHDRKQFVRMSGDVQVRSKSATLLNPSNFGVIEADDLF